MSEYPPDPEQPVYTPPPVTAPPAPPPPRHTYPAAAGQPGHPPSPYPSAYPPAPYPYAGYPPPYPNPYPPAGYPAPYPYAYPQYVPYVRPGSGRPGLATAAAVLAYVVGGLLIIAGIVLLAGASLVHDVGSKGGFDTRDATAELTFDGIVDFVAAGLLIAGGILLSGRRPTGRVLLLTAVAIDVGAVIYWLNRAGTGGGTVVFYSLVFTAPLVVAASFVATPTVRRWLAGEAAASER